MARVSWRPERFDLHVHSERSYDGRGTLLEIAQAAQEHGLSGFAITDHNTPADRKEIRHAMEKTGLIIIAGNELTTVEGHMLVYGVTDELAKGPDVREVADAVDAAGGVVVPSHPLRMVSGIGPTALQELAPRFAAVEAVNGRDRRLVQQNTLALAKALGLATIGGTDAHWVVDVGTAWTVFRDPISSEADLLEALRRGRCKGEGDSLTRRKVLAHSVGAPWRKIQQRRQERNENLEANATHDG